MKGMRCSNARQLIYTFLSTPLMSLMCNFQSWVYSRKLYISDTSGSQNKSGHAPVQPVMMALYLRCECRSTRYKANRKPGPKLYLAANLDDEPHLNPVPVRWITAPFFWTPGSEIPASMEVSGQPPSLCDCILVVVFPDRL